MLASWEEAGLGAPPGDDELGKSSAAAAEADAAGASVCVARCGREGGMMLGLEFAVEGGLGRSGMGNSSCTI